MGLPSSSSHALVGGMVGVGVAKAGFDVVVTDGLRKIGVFIVYSPLVGLALAFTLSVIVTRLVHRIKAPRKLNKTFRVLQLFSAAGFSLGHGANDVQKTMGIILAVLIAEGKISGDVTEVPTWVVWSAHGAIGLGTLFGGWKIVRTMGTRLTKLQPMSGVCAETAASAVLFFTSAQGIPVSTTHTIAGSIVGVGSANRLSAVRWNIARRVMWAWVLTIPGAACVAAFTYWFVAALS